MRADGFSLTGPSQKLVRKGSILGNASLGVQKLGRSVKYA